jgi:hypothetical protein
MINSRALKLAQRRPDGFTDRFDLVVGWYNNRQLQGSLTFFS